MTDGDLAIYTDTTGTHNLCTVEHTYVGVPFNNQNVQDGIFTQDANDIDVALNATGKFLIIYNIYMNDSYSNRYQLHARVMLNSVEIVGSKDAGYKRDATNDDLFLSGSCIVDNVTSGHLLRIEVTLKGSNNPVTSPMQVDSSFMVLKIADDWNYCRLGKSAISTINSESFQDVTWEVETEKDATSFTHTANSASIEVEETGFYLVSYGVELNGPSSRYQYRSRIMQNAAAIPTTYSGSYNRGQSDTFYPILSGISILSLSANDILKLQICVESEPSTIPSVTTVNANCGISIVKLPSSAQVLSVHNDAIQTISAGGGAIIIHNTENVENAAFNHSLSTGRITIVEAGSYLMTYGCESLRNGTSASRDIHQLVWYKNGVDANLGSLGWYVRGTQSSVDTFYGGQSGGVIFHDLAIDDIIDLRHFELGSMSNQDELQAGAHGLTAVKIDSLFSAPSSDWEHDVNGVLNANIDQIDGVALANIDQIDGV